MSYLMVAYGFAAVTLAGYLVWSLRHLRQLKSKREG